MGTIRRRRALAGVAVAGAIALCVLGSVGAPAGAVSNDVLAFTSNRDGTAQIYTMNADGSGQARVTSSVPNDDIQPTWSPDGTKLAFSRGIGYQSGNLVQSSIVVRDLSAGTERVVASDSGVNFRPAWSPDGTRIAYVHGGAAQSPFDIWLVDPDGSDKVALTTTGDSTQPAWSPDGHQIVYDKGPSIWAIDVATRAARVVTSPPAGTSDFTPSWAPGSRILFTSTRDPGHKQVFAVDPDGSHVQRLVDDGAEDKYPVWSPDGARIAYSRSTVPCQPIQVGGQSECSQTQLGGYEIFVMNADGSGSTRITTRPVTEREFGESYPVFKPRPVPAIPAGNGGYGAAAVPAPASGARGSARVAGAVTRLPETGRPMGLFSGGLALVLAGVALLLAARLAPAGVGVTPERGRGAS